MAVPPSAVTDDWISLNIDDSNFTRNTSRLVPGADMSADPIDMLEKTTTPIVCLVGTVLNLLAVGAFLSSPLRKTSCCLYLATRSLAVFGVLISIIIAWSNSLFPLMNTPGVCEITVFLSYICPFISVWMVVTISVENFIRIAQPARVSTLCTPRVAKCVIAVFVMVGVIVYNFPLWTSRVIGGNCDVLDDFMQVVLVYNYIDAALTLFCPFIVMTIVVPLVGFTAISAYERKKRLSGGSDTARSRTQSTDKKSTPESKVTRLLLAVSLVFLIFHTPFHVIRTKVFIFALSNTRASRTDEIFLHIFRLIYNLDTCVSCAVYLIFGDNFRQVFCKIYFSRCQRALERTSTFRDSKKRECSSETPGTVETANHTDINNEINGMREAEKHTDAGKTEKHKWT